MDYRELLTDLRNKAAGEIGPEETARAEQDIERVEQVMQPYLEEAATLAAMALLAGAPPTQIYMTMFLFGAYLYQQSPEKAPEVPAAFKE